MASDLLDTLLSKPVGPAVPPRTLDPEKDFTRELEVTRDTISATIRGEVGTVSEGTALQYLQEEGQNPEEWEVTHFRKLKWGPPDNPYESVKFSFKRKALLGERPPLDDLFAGIERYEPVLLNPDSYGEYGMIVGIGDMQFGKIDGDGVEGTLARTIDYINKAADLLAWNGERFGIGHIHIAWLGDHIEGFVSQGGANTWRTQLTLNEQIRLTRRVMLHALTTFGGLAPKLSMAAVPGNHGEAVRFMGKGVTRYDDSHDTESLISVSDAVDLTEPGKFGDVKFYVPTTDELTVVLDVAGTTVAHAHGHQWRPGKHFDWWRGQAFNRDSSLNNADLLLAGHLHHEFIEGDGDRLFMQVPAIESESTWYKHAKGTGGNPGLLVAVTKDGVTNNIEVVR